jgi:hypothetical protein
VVTNERVKTVTFIRAFAGFRKNKAVFVKTAIRRFFSP